MAVRVDEAREHEATLQVERARARADEACDTGVGADVDELPVLDRGSPRHRMRRIDGVDGRVPQHQVRGLSR